MYPIHAGERMPEHSLLTQLLELPNVRILGYALINHDHLNVMIESTLVAAVCPSCQQISEVTHGHAEQQLIRDLSIWQRQCELRYLHVASTAPVVR